MTIGTSSEGDARLEPGSVVASYRIEESWRAGRAYLALQPALGRRVVLHVAPGPPGSAEAERFLAEARRLAALDHEGITTVYEVGVADGVAFAAAGVPAGAARLSERLSAGPLPADRVVELSVQLAPVLDALHDTGQIPPLDPGAILVSDDRVWLAPLDLPASQSSETPAAALAQLLDGAAGEPDRRSLEAVLHRATSYESASALAHDVRAALAGRPPRRRSVWAAGVAAAVAATAAGVLMVAVRTDDEKPPADGPAGRVSKTIALGGAPASVTFGEGAVWAATEDRRVLRIDPETNSVQGAPVRFSSGRGPSNITVRAGGGAVYAMDSSTGTIARIDPALGRVVRRARHRYELQGLAVGDEGVWLTRTTPPDVQPRRDEVVRLDEETLRPTGRPAPVGTYPFDVELHDGGVFVVSAGDGTVTRVDARTGASRIVMVAGQPINAAFAGGALWVAAAADGTVTPLATGTLRLAGDVIRQTSPVSAVALGDSLWVLGQREPNPDAPADLHRIDPRSGDAVGRPVNVGTDVGWPVSGAGALWVPSPGREALLRVDPASPAPASHAPARTDGRTVRSGPVAAGTWEVATAGIRVSFGVADDGWIAITPNGDFDLFELRRIEEPDVWFGLLVPQQIIAPNGDVRPVRSAAQLLAAIRRHPNVRTGPERATSVGGLAARTVDVRARRHRGYPPYCVHPCVPLYARGPFTVHADADGPTRLTVLEVGGRTVAITEDAAGASAGSNRTREVLRTLRFR